MTDVLRASASPAVDDGPRTPDAAAPGTAPAAPAAGSGATAPRGTGTGAGTGADPAAAADEGTDGGVGDEVREAVHAVCRAAQVASRRLRTATGATKDAALRAAAAALVAATDRVVAANAEDLGRAERDGVSPYLRDRLRLDAGRIEDIAGAMADVVALADPVGEVVRGSTLPNGLRVRQVRRPLGVVGVVYEARPNVTVDAVALALKSGNAVVLRGGSAAAATNAVVVEVLRESLVASGLPADLVSTIDAHGREGVRALLRARGLVDVVVPRGGADLIRTVVETATVPTIETGTGNCHVYVDAAADLDEALAVCLNAKVQRPGVCNSAETVLVHRDVAEEFVPALASAMAEAGVVLHGDTTTQELAVGVPVRPATDEDWAAEYLSLDLAVRVVDDLDQALEHIDTWSSRHTEAICTTDTRAAERFVAEVDAAAVAVNASTRFTDGAQLGLGAEIGISTQKLHARGPMGLTELTTTTWVVTGDGHVRT
ncbi:glutamate-5-semialdehyde dehydrogenase [Aquipuribacter hungaricus]|uniref:Gamma-glutamyl phosphate reductase n=2 Tax=Aquipuribacter hungaricus TaxID=545624 RepID=A0ABV7WH44_9MICO